MATYKTPREVREDFEDWVRFHTNWYIVTDSNTGNYLPKTQERFDCFMAGYKLGARD